MSRQSDSEERGTSAYTQYNLPNPEYRFQDIIGDNQDIVDEVKMQYRLYAEVSETTNTNIYLLRLLMLMLIIIVAMMMMMMMMMMMIMIMIMIMIMMMMMIMILV